MKSQISSGKPRKPKLFSVRRVVGPSMLPTLKPGQIVIGIRHKPTVGSLVIVRYMDREIIKRLTKVDQSKVFIMGDNPQQSMDSRIFGWLPKNSLVTTVIWPKN